MKELTAERTMQIDELSGVTLTPEQIETVQMAARFVPLRLRAEFMKGLGDRLRPIRDIKGTDVNHHIVACLQLLPVVGSLPALLGSRAFRLR